MRFLSLLVVLLSLPAAAEVMLGAQGGLLLPSSGRPALGTAGGVVRLAWGGASEQGAGIALQAAGHVPLGPSSPFVEAMLGCLWRWDAAPDRQMVAQLGANLAMGRMSGGAWFPPFGLGPSGMLGVRFPVLGDGTRLEVHLEAFLPLLVNSGDIAVVPRLATGLVF